jgi:NhaP-type Na+/H+ or K+/H+ antiporter
MIGITDINIIALIALILLIGLLGSMFARKLRIPEILVLLVIGAVLAFIKYNGEPLIKLPILFLICIGILALAMIVFDSSSKFAIREFDHFSINALKFVCTYIIFNLILLSTAVHFMFKMSWGLSAVFALMMSATSQEIIFPLFAKHKHRAVELLKRESILGIPIAILLAFIAIIIIQDFSLGVGISESGIYSLMPFIVKLLAGIGSGILVGFILFKALKKKYSPLYSQLAVIIAALLAYVLAEKLNGSGVVAVTALGVFFGNLLLRKGKEELLQFESLIAKALFILVLVLIGIMIKIPLETEFILSALLLFVIFIVIRYLAIAVSFRGKRELSFKSKLFMALSAAKGIPIAVVIFFLAVYNASGTKMYLAGMSTLLDLSLLFIILTIIVGAVMVSTSRFFIDEKSRE